MIGDLTATSINNAPTSSCIAEFSGEIKLRHLCPEDIEELKILCSQWFPIEYPNFWYEDITSNAKFFALAATSNERIIGLIVADVNKIKSAIDRDDWYVLSNSHPSNSQLTYILSLGVSNEFRRHGIASLLLTTLINHLSKNTNCKAVYLHVLHSNTGAIRFYEKKNFQKRILLPKYYTINGQLQDGYCYVLYMNGGTPPFSFTELVYHAYEKLQGTNPCDLIHYLTRGLTNLFRVGIRGGVNRNYLNSSTKDFYRIS